MRKLASSAPFVGAALILLAVQPSFAQTTKPIQIALVNPIQIFKETESIAGIRLNLIYGKNVDVTGLDWGLFNHTTGNGVAWQAGLVGMVEHDFTGLQDNWVNITKGTCTGIQWGLYNQAKDGSGFQLGFVNMTENMHGIQLGLLNVTETMNGLQVGLGNVIHKGAHPFLPIVNWSF